MKRRFAPAKINHKVVITLVIVVVTASAALVGGHYIRKRMIADQALEEGRAAIQRRDWPEAARHLRRYLGKYPDDATALREYGQACLRTRPRASEQVAAAVGAYRRLLRLDKEDLEAYRRLTELNARLGDTANVAQTAERWAAAAARANEAAPARANEAAPQLWWARSEIVRRDFAGAQKRLREVVGNHPGCVDAYTLLAAIEGRDGKDAVDPAAAMSWHDLSVEQSGGAADAHLHRAQFLARPGAGGGEAARERARADLDAAEKAETASHLTWLGIAAEWLSLGDAERSSTALQRAARAWDERTPDDLDDSDDWLATFTIQQTAVAMQTGDFAGGAKTADAALDQLTQPGHRMRLLPEAIRLDISVRDFDRTRRRLDELVSLQPPQQGPIADTISLLRAALAAGEGRPYDTIAELESLVARNSSVSEVWRLLAAAYDQTGQTRRAVRALRECVKLAPRQVEPLIALLRLQVRQQDWDAALSTAALAEPLVQGKGDFRLLLLQARSGALSQNHRAEDLAGNDQLITEAEALQRDDPSRIDPYMALSALHARAGRTARAEEELNRAIAACAEPLPAEMQLVRLHAIGNRLDRAEAAARAACERHPASAAAAMLLSSVQRAAGNSAASVETLQEAKRRITDPAQRRELILALASINEPADPVAREEGLRELAIADSTDIRARAWLLELPGVREDSAGAQRLLDEIREVERDNGTTWRLQQARLWLARDDWESRKRDVEAHLTRCIENEPGWAEPVLALGGMHERSNEWAKAEATYQRALGLNAGETQVAGRLVSVLEKQGKLDEARRVLDQYARGTDAFDEQRLRVALGSRDFDEAATQLEQRLRQDPDDAQSRAMLASLTFHRTGDADAALKLLGDPQQPDSASLARAVVRVSILRSAKRDDEARAFLDDLISSRADFAAHLLRAEFRKQTGDLPGAEADLRKGVELSSSGEGHLALALFWSTHQRLDDAAQLLEEGLTRFPGNERLQRMQIRVLLDRKQGDDWRRAVALLGELKNRHPDDLELMWIQARLKLAAGNPEAEGLMLDIVKLEPRTLDAHLALIGLALKRGDVGEARQRIGRALAALHDNLKLGLLHARVEFAAGNPSAAMDVLRAVLRVYPKDGEAQRMFLDAAVQSRAPELLQEALRFADRWLGEPPVVEPLHVARALVLAALGRADDAISSLEAVRDDVSSDARRSVLLTLASLYRSNSDFDRAEAYLQQAAGAGASGTPLIREQWLLLGQQTRFDDLASSVAEYARDPQPDPDLLLLGAAVLAKSPAHADSVPAIFERIIKVAPDRTDVRVEYGLILFRRGDTAQAEALYRELLVSEPKNAAALNNLAWILVSGRREREYDEALRLADRAVSLFPANPSFLDTRALVFERLGRLPQARADYERCVALTETNPAANADARRKLAELNRLSGKVE